MKFRSLAGPLLAAAVWAQEPVRERAVTPRPDPEPAGSNAALTILILYPQGVFSEAQARAWEQNLHGFFKIEIESRAAHWHSARTDALLEAMLEGAKLTKADAARASAGSETLGQIFARNQVAGLVVRRKGGGESCPPSDCGCDNSGIYTCECTTKLKDRDCFCKLCLLGSTTTSRFGRSLVILVADDWRSVPKLAQVAQRELRQMGPPTANLVIKTKSTPP